jgi:hypothetical protein
VIFSLTQKQSEFLRPIAEQVRAAWAAGEPGSVVAQVWSDGHANFDADSLTLVEAMFVPATVAEQLQQVLRAHYGTAQQEAQP